MEPDVIAHRLNPAFMGGPTWPNLRQAFVTARRQGQLLVASDGLSDPFADPGDGDGNGFGIEFYAATVDPLQAVPGSWLLDLVWQMSQNAAAHGDLADLLAEQGAGVHGAVRRGHPAAAARALRGRRGPRRGPGRVDRGHAAAGRHELARRLAAQGLPLVSSLQRPSVV